MLKKIIAGDQPGVELAALDAAIRLDIPHEGWSYQGRQTEKGVLPKQYNVNGIGNSRFYERILQNITDSDGIVILTNGSLTIGLKGAIDLAGKHNKRSLHVDLTKCKLNHAISSIRKWMTNNDIEAVYFTGSKPTGTSNIYNETVQIIEGICRTQREQEKLPGFQDEEKG